MGLQPMEMKMAKKRLPSSDVVERAQELYEQAKSNGTLKAPRGLVHLRCGNGYSRSVPQKEVTYLDYMPDARRELKKP